jgi:TolA-binding protein
VRLGRALERSGKTDQALANYRQVVKDYPDTPSAKTAKERLKDLEKD